MKQNIPLILGIVAIFSIIVIVGVLVVGNLQKNPQQSISPTPVENKASSTTYSTTVDFTNSQSITPAETISPTSSLAHATITPSISPTSALNITITTIPITASQSLSPTIVTSPTEIPLVVTMNPSISPVISPTKKVIASLPKTGWGQATMAMIGFAGALVLFSFLF